MNVPEARILLVANSPRAYRLLGMALLKQGYELADAQSPEDALERVRLEKYDLVLVDIDVPRVTVRETCRKIRLFFGVPVIVTTTKDSEKDKVALLDAGADDYVAKPFSVPEMLARIRAALRRSTPRVEPARSVRLGDIEVDFLTRRVITPNAQLPLTSKEFELLSYLAAHPNRPITHRELLHAVWGPEYGQEHEYLRVFVSRLRKKIEPSPREPRYLLKEPWIGYRLDVPPQ